MNKSISNIKNFEKLVKDFEKETKFNGYTKEELEEIYYKRKASFQ